MFNGLFGRRGIRRIVLLALLAVAAVIGVLFANYITGQPTVAPAAAEEKLAEQIAKEVVTACPLADPADKKARDECGQKLGNSKLLSSSTAVPVLWGQQQQIGNFNYKTNPTTTKFHPLVMWRVYLSLFMFNGDYRIEQVAGPGSSQLTVVHMPFQYRNKLDMGEYPYPYWHSKKKWDSFQFSPEVVMIIDQGKVAAVFRGAERDRSRSYTKREWDGRWHWTGANGEQEPRVTLYEYLFSKSNPYVHDLDVAFRELDTESRKHSCQVCHNPGNPALMAPLGIMEYPNQALSLRHRIVKVMEANRMPPAGVATNGDKQEFTPPGIADEAVRQKYLQVARKFAELGDKALEYEGQRLQ